MKNLLFLFLFLLSAFTPSFSIGGLPEPVAHVHAVQETVYVTETGSKYHRSSCHYLKKSKIKTTKSKAKNSGYTACKVCKP